MESANELEKRLQEKLALRDERRVIRQTHTQQLMSETGERMKRYSAVADGMMETIIRPRMERLKKCVEALNAPQMESTRHTCRLLFKHTSEFPATATLELGVTRDGEGTTVMVQYDASIVPLFFSLEGKDHISMAIGGVDEAKVADWIDDKVLHFVDAYLQLETTDQYQSENSATDPVCGMSVNKTEATAQMNYQGATYFFCIDDCRKRFAENPDRYLTGSKTAAGPS